MSVIILIISKEFTIYFTRNMIKRSGKITEWK